MHDSAPNIAESFRCSLLIYDWWGILQVSRATDNIYNTNNYGSCPQLRLVGGGGSKSFLDVKNPP